MEITRVTVEVLDTPLESGYVAAGNAVSSNYHILSRIETEGGVQGIGFAVATRPALVKPVALAARELGQLLPGSNVLEREAARAKMLHAGGWAGPGGVLTIAMATLDIALWDAADKIMGQPLYRMLGGHENRVRAYASDGLWYSLSLEELTRNATAHVAAGYDKIKLRLGGEERPEGEVARVRAVQDAAGPGSGTRDSRGPCPPAGRGAQRTPNGVYAPLRAHLQDQAETGGRPPAGSPRPGLGIELDEAACERYKVE